MSGQLVFGDDTEWDVPSQLYGPIVAQLATAVESRSPMLAARLRDALDVGGYEELDDLRREDFAALTAAMDDVWSTIDDTARRLFTKDDVRREYIDAARDLQSMLHRFAKGT